MSGIVDQLIKKISPMIEERIGELKKEAEEEFKTVNGKLDRIVELLEKE